MPPGSTGVNCASIPACFHSQTRYVLSQPMWREEMTASLFQESSSASRSYTSRNAATTPNRRGTESRSTGGGTQDRRLRYRMCSTRGRKNTANGRTALATSRISDTGCEGRLALRSFAARSPVPEPTIACWTLSYLSVSVVSGLIYFSLRLSRRTAAMDCFNAAEMSASPVTI